MIAKLEFNLPEEQEEFEVHMSAFKLLRVLKEYREYMKTLRDCDKWPNDGGEHLWDMFHTMTSDEGVGELV
jgi:hypothetical protein